MPELAGRSALVTGGTRGIGAAISIELKQQGMKVAANYAGNDERAQEFSQSTGIPVYKFDVSDYEQCRQGVQRLCEDLGGPVEVLVNNAGLGYNGPFQNGQAWDRELA